MKAMLLALCEHLKEKRYNIVREVAVQVEIYDPTYGNRVETQTFETVDFDALIGEIDEFAQSFQTPEDLV